MKTTKCYVREGHYEMGEPALMILPHKESGTHPARIVWESDFRKLMKLVRDVAAMNGSHSCAKGLFCGKCLTCRARKLLEEKLK